MSAPPDVSPRRRITVALRGGSADAGLLGSATRLAQEIYADLSGVFLEDIDLLRLAELPQVNLDRAAIEKVVVNLIGNALKFTDTGGRVEVRGTVAPDGGVHLVVSDTGIGLPADQLDRIFDRFYRVGRDMQRQAGLGLGLFIVRTLVRRNGGDVVAESDGTGLGSRFRVELRAAPGGVPALATARPAVEGA